MKSRWNTCFEEVFTGNSYATEHVSSTEALDAGTISHEVNKDLNSQQVTLCANYLSKHPYTSFTIVYLEIPVLYHKTTILE